MKRINIKYIWVAIIIIITSTIMIGEFRKTMANYEPSITLYVSPTGIDTNDGTSSDKPFKTIEKALEKAMNEKYITSSNVVINLASGTYNIIKPIEISEENTNGESNHTLTFQGNGSTISGGVTLNPSWTKDSENIWKIDLNSYNLDVVPDLWINGKKMTIAQQDLATNLFDVEKNSDNKATSATFTDTSGKLDAASLKNDINNMWIDYRWSFTFNHLLLSDVIQSTNGTTLKLNNDTLIALGKKNTLTPSYHTTNTNNTIYMLQTIKNAYSLLNEEGEFYYNKSSKTLYYYSTKSPNDSECIISIADGLVNVIGKESKLASNIEFNNIRFMYSNSMTDDKYPYISEQADNITTYNSSGLSSTFRTGQIKLEYASNISFEHCTFKDISSTVITMDKYVYNTSITNSLFENIGGSAIRVGTVENGDQLSRDNKPQPSDFTKVYSVDSNTNFFPCKINISNNSFENIANKYLGSVAVQVFYANTANIENNSFNNTSYDAVSIGWGWHNENSTQAITKKSGNVTVKNNKMQNVVNQMVDGAPIYFLGYSALRNVVSGNYINTNMSENGYNGGIYLDEGSDNIEVTGNLVIDCQNWIDERRLTSVIDGKHTISYSTLMNIDIHDNYYYANASILNAPGSSRLNAHLVEGANVTYTNNQLISDWASNSITKSIIDTSGYSGNVGASYTKPTNISVSSISLNKKTLELNEGVSESLTYTITPTDATNKNVKWTSSNPDIAEVSDTGLVIAKKQGTTTITVTTEDGEKTDTCNVTVQKEVKNITNIVLNKNTLELIEGNNEKLTYTITPTDATNKNVKWTSSNPDIAEVSDTGLVIAKKQGTTTITVTTEDGQKKAICNVDVIQKNISSISIKQNINKLQYIVGTESLDVTGGILLVEYNNKTSKEIPITKEMISGFDGNKVGEQQLTINYEGKTTIFNITVLENKVEKIEILDLPKKLEYIQNHENLTTEGGNISVTYSNNETNIVPIKEEYISGFDTSKVGKQTLTVNYGEQKSSFEINVIEELVTAIALKKDISKTTYIKDKEVLALDGEKILVTYNDKITEEIDITDDMISGFDNTKVGTQNVNITYKDKVISFPINIIEEPSNEVENNYCPTNKNANSKIKECLNSGNELSFCIEQHCINNPKTGNIFTYMLVILTLIISCLSIFLFNRNYRKNI